MRNLLKPALVALLWPSDAHTDSPPTIFAWGNNTSGQLGIGSEISKSVPSAIDDLSREQISSIFSSPQCNSSAALTSSGSLFTWGNGLDNILGHNAGDSNVILPTQVSLSFPIAKLAVGGGHMLGLTSSGSLISWGLDDCGQCGQAVVRQSVDPRAFRPQLLRGKSPGAVVGELEGEQIVSISCGKYFSVALSASGKVFTWGAGREYALGHGDRTAQPLPKRVSALDGVHIVQVACGRNFVVAVDKDGGVHAWGNNDYGQLGMGQTERFKALPAKLRTISGVVEVACGDFHVLALNSAGEVWSWGQGADGQLGHGNASNQGTPSLIAGLPKIARIVCGGGHSAFVTREFGLLMCGRGSDGQLARQGKFESIASNRMIPVEIEMFRGKRVLQAAAGMHHSLALVMNK
jgi:alpha-tubulin suppressor-like RCC1 family protein